MIPKIIAFPIIGIVMIIMLILVKKYNPGVVWINAIYYIILLVLLAILT